VFWVGPIRKAGFRMRALWLTLVMALGLVGCAEERVGKAPPGDRFQYPVGVAIHPDGYALVVSSNADLAYREGTLLAVDLKGLAASDLSSPAEDDPYFTRFILSDGGLALENFGGAISLSADGTKAAVPVRSTTQVILVDLDTQGGTSPLTLSCWPDGVRPKGDLPYCEGARSVLNVEVKDPFSALLIDMEEGPQGMDRLLLVGGLQGKTLDAYRLEAGVEPYLGYQFPIEDSGQIGIDDLVWSPALGLVFASVRYPASYTNTLFYFDPFLGDEVDLQQISVYPLVLGNEIRSLAFSQDGWTLGALVFNPYTLALLDLGLDEQGLLVVRRVRPVSLGFEPSVVRAHGDLFLVTAAYADTVWAIDGRTASPIARRQDVCQGPFGIGFYDPPDGRQWAVVSCYSDGQLAILDVDRNSPGFMDVLARVGTPRKEH
jgi:hypothetical protein